jgi:hypothetical protein
MMATRGEQTLEDMSKEPCPSTSSLQLPPSKLAKMGVLAKVEDRPTPPCVYNWRVYLSAIVAAFSSCMIGYTTSFIGTTVALDSFQEYYGLDQLSDSKASFISANIVSLFQAGAFFGSIFAYTTSFFLGRRASIWIFISTFLVGAGITLSPSHSLGPLYAGRVISGFGVGGCTMVVSQSRFMCSEHVHLPTTSAHDHATIKYLLGFALESVVMTNMSNSTLYRSPSSYPRSPLLPSEVDLSDYTNSDGKPAVLSAFGSSSESQKDRLL